jgi:hypothetical protein
MSTVTDSGYPAVDGAGSGPHGEVRVVFLTGFLEDEPGGVRMTETWGPPEDGQVGVRAGRSPREGPRRDAAGTLS